MANSTTLLIIDRIIEKLANAQTPLTFEQVNTALKKSGIHVRCETVEQHITRYTTRKSQ